MNNCGRDTRTRNENLFVVYLYTECANSQTEREPQGGEPLLKRRCGESNKQSLLLGAALVLAITNRASPVYSQNKTGKNSNRNSVRVLAWWVRAMHASGKTLTYSRRSYMTTLPFRRRNTSRKAARKGSAELDD